MPSERETRTAQPGTAMHRVDPDGDGSPHPGQPGARSATSVHAAGDRPTVAPALTAVIVAVPARNEAATIAACLSSIDSAAARVDLPVTVVVAADSCRDDTVAARSPGAGLAMLASTSSRVAGAEPEGRAEQRSWPPSSPSAPRPPTVWIANTDADCVVPGRWIRRQLGYAACGKVAVAGTVMLDPATTSEALLAAFVATYRAADRAHRHVHAANLGLRADVYEAIGGWSPHTVVGEDHDLWRRLRLAGGLIDPTVGCCRRHEQPYHGSDHRWVRQHPRPAGPPPWYRRHSAS